MYGFSEEITKCRGYELDRFTFKKKQTNLILAIETIKEKIETCKHKYIRVFFFTDGDHTTNDRKPEHLVRKLKPPPDKNLQVFVLGLGDLFPVSLSLDFRSTLHNGSSNIPTLFWAKEPGEVKTRLEFMAEFVETGFKEWELPCSGYLLPNNDTTSKIAPDEWIYYNCPKKGITRESTKGKKIKNGLNINMSSKPISLKTFVQNVTPQWTAKILQMHRNIKNASLELKELDRDGFGFGFRDDRRRHLGSLDFRKRHHQSPFKIFRSYDDDEDDYRMRDFMMHQSHYDASKVPKAIDHVQKIFDSIFKHAPSISNPRVSGRFDSYKKSTALREFNTKMDHLKEIVLEDKGPPCELKLAESILKSTVTTSKFNDKVIKMRGHTDYEFSAEVTDFQTIYDEHKDEIMSLPDPDPEDCCRIMMSSTLADLKDSDFPLLLKKNKFDFMKNFTISGIPIMTPKKDSVLINPWSIWISNILVTPYTIMSQRALEEYFEMNDAIKTEEKYYQLKNYDETTRFNAVVPVFSAKECLVLKPIIRSKLFAMCTTFAILKNPHIIDYNCHVAALSSIWVKTITEYPKENRPEFATRRLDAIVSTGKIYLDRKGYSSYIKVLMSEPCQALMSESKKIFTDDFTVKCETFNKPMFLMQLYADTHLIEAKDHSYYLKLILMEYFGRCLKDPQYMSNGATPYTDLFGNEIYDEDDRKVWLENKTKLVLENMAHDSESLLKKYFTVESLNDGINSILKTNIEKALEFIKEIDIKICRDKILGMTNFVNCGDLTANSIKAFALEYGIAEDIVEECFSDKMVIYCY